MFAKRSNSYVPIKEWLQKSRENRYPLMCPAYLPLLVLQNSPVKYVIKLISCKRQHDAINYWSSRWLRKDYRESHCPLFQVPRKNMLSCHILRAEHPEAMQLIDTGLTVTFTSKKFPEQALQESIIRSLVKCQRMAIMEIWRKFHRMRLAQHLQEGKKNTDMASI